MISRVKRLRLWQHNRFFNRRSRSLLRLHIHSPANKLLGLIAGLALWATVLSPQALADDTSLTTDDMLSTEWQEITAGFSDLAVNVGQGLQNPGDRQARYELYEFIMSQIASGYPMLFYADPAHPDFWPLFNNLFNQGLPNPDTMYLITPVDASGVYRVSGYVGTVLMADIQQGGGEFLTEGRISGEGGGLGTAYGNDSLYDLNTTEQGYFEVIYSARKPEGYQGDWRQLDSRSTYLILRQIAYDWISERDARIAIERLDVSDPPLRPNADELKARMTQLTQWAQNYVRLSFGLMNQGRRKRGLNRFDFTPYSESGFTTQKYLAASYDLTPDTALVIETDVPECLYWSFQTSTAQWRSINPLFFRSSINGFQAHLDEDGKFRAVISDRDPGVPNWLATGGHNVGEVLVRWNDCDSAPIPEARLVRMSELRDYLPAGTPEVSSEQRAQALRQLRSAFQMRRRW